MRKTYGARPIYLSRLAYISYACQRLLNNEDKFVLQAADDTHRGTTSSSTVCFTVNARADVKMHSVAQPTDIQGAVLQNMGSGMESDLMMEPSVSNKNRLMEENDALQHTEPNAASVATPSQIHETVLQNHDSETEANAVLQNLAPSPALVANPNHIHDTVLQNLDPGSAADAVLQDLVPTEDDSKDDESHHDTDAEDNDETGEDDLKNNERDTLDADLIQMKTLRSTTSTHDDWLHRGPYLNDMPFHTYTEYIDRVRRPRQASPSHQLFEFEAHYALSRSYCQEIKTPARTPVLEALKFVAPGDGKNEENALYKHLVASLTRCTCANGCSDPMLMKPLLLPIRTSEKPARWSFQLAWKVRRAELEVQARRGGQKIKRAMRIACIKDTTLLRGWLRRAGARGLGCSRGVADVGPGLVVVPAAWSARGHAASDSNCHSSLRSKRLFLC